MTTTADICVIGSGAGGGTLASVAALAGLDVLVIEKGRWHRSEDFIHDEIASCRRDFFVPSPVDDPHMVVHPGRKQAERSTMGWIASCVGGGTVHMAGYFYRLHPDDFRMKDKFGSIHGLQLADWPFDYAALEPYYSRVEQAIGVSGATGANPFEGPRSQPYCLPPVANHPLAAWIDDACQKLGVTAFPSPRAVLSQPYRGRSACVYCDFCGSYGCEVGAKSSTLAAMLPEALASGHCTIRAGSMVREITLGANGRASGCILIRPDGTEERIRARAVVVSCSAVESARLLLLSRSKSFPDGLANSSGLVGRHLQFSSFASGQAAWPFDSFRGDPHKLATLQHRHPFLGRSVQDYYFLPDGVSDLPKGGTIRFGFPHANPIFTALRLAHETSPPQWGQFLKDRLRQYWSEQRAVEFEAFGDFFPNPGTWVEIDPSVKDRWGLPVARIHYQIPDQHVRAGRFLRDRGLEILEACGAENLEPGAEADVTGHLVHGTCRAGIDPAHSVLDPNCRAWDVTNLYVVDGAFMPTSGGAPTTLTIMANAWRVADNLAARFRRGEL